MPVMGDSMPAGSCRPRPRPGATATQLDRDQFARLDGARHPSGHVDGRPRPAHPRLSRQRTGDTMRPRGARTIEADRDSMPATVRLHAGRFCRLRPRPDYGSGPAHRNHGAAMVPASRRRQAETDQPRPSGQRTRDTMRTTQRSHD